MESTPVSLNVDCGEPGVILNGNVTFLSYSKKQYLSVIEYHCNEPYYTFPGQKKVTNRVHRRIIGGQWAAPGSIPWQVFLTVPYGRGGAAVIGSRWILTAAHILNDVLPEHVRVEMNLSFQIYVGDNDILKMLESPPFQVESLHVHPLYNNPKERNYNHDIALIKLKQHITFNTNIMPLCLPSRDHQYIPDTYGLVSGFGMTEDKKIPTKLRFVRVPLVKDDVCRKSIEKITNETSEDFKFTENMFCAGFPEGGRDSCSGDGGGAFALENNNQFWAAGIVSWGVNCGEAGKYGVYTRVAQYSGWINDIMEGKLSIGH
ncbi:complement C1r subcomponent-like [Denticeps clupeoides]|uniref:complement C1r subcomponent-like n=1 Tax=Denticeps clupeoides TaxID=299321 RepID=UPI0010A4FC63|nr:complement C1r subcomponent-like [Denticeps clupeoides]